MQHVHGYLLFNDGHNGTLFGAQRTLSLIFLRSVKATTLYYFFSNT